MLTPKSIPYVSNTCTCHECFTLQNLIYIIVSPLVGQPKSTFLVSWPYSVVKLWSEFLLILTHMVLVGTHAWRWWQTCFMNLRCPPVVGMAENTSFQQVGSTGAWSVYYHHVRANLFMVVTTRSVHQWLHVEASSIRCYDTVDSCGPNVRAKMAP